MRVNEKLNLLLKIAQKIAVSTSSNFFTFSRSFWACIIWHSADTKNTFGKLGLHNVLIETKLNLFEIEGHTIELMNLIYPERQYFDYTWT